MKRQMNKTIIQVVLALTIVAFTVTAFADDTISVTELEGSALVREVGEYLWRSPEVGQAVYAGDRIRLRSGEMKMVFPQGSMLMYGNGEVELPVALVNNLVEPWNNDLALFVGSYDFDLSEEVTEQPLHLVTLFGRIVASHAAKFDIRVTPKGTILTVLSGQVRVHHRLLRDVYAKNVKAGDVLRINSEAMRIYKGEAAVLAIK